MCTRTSIENGPYTRVLTNVILHNIHVQVHKSIHAYANKVDHVPNNRNNDNVYACQMHEHVHMLQIQVCTTSYAKRSMHIHIYVFACGTTTMSDDFRTNARIHKTRTPATTPAQKHTRSCTCAQIQR